MNYQKLTCLENNTQKAFDLNMGFDVDFVMLFTTLMGCLFAYLAYIFYVEYLK